ncbi:unnamed protein product [Sympodiomycopsis kandeliae]
MFLLVFHIITIVRQECSLSPSNTGNNNDDVVNTYDISSDPDSGPKSLCIPSGQGIVRRTGRVRRDQSRRGSRLEARSSELFSCHTSNYCCSGLVTFANWPIAEFEKAEQESVVVSNTGLLPLHQPSFQIGGLRKLSS